MTNPEQIAARLHFIYCWQTINVGGFFSIQRPTKNISLDWLSLKLSAHDLCVNLQFLNFTKLSFQESVLRGDINSEALFFSLFALLSLDDMYLLDPTACSNVNNGQSFEESTPLNVPKYTRTTGFCSNFGSHQTVGWVLRSSVWSSVLFMLFRSPRVGCHKLQDHQTIDFRVTPPHTHKRTQGDNLTVAHLTMPFSPGCDPEVRKFSLNDNDTHTKWRVVPNLL